MMQRWMGRLAAVLFATGILLFVPVIAGALFIEDYRINLVNPDLFVRMGIGFVLSSIAPLVIYIWLLERRERHGRA